MLRILSASSCSRINCYRNPNDFNPPNDTSHAAVQKYQSQVKSSVASALITLATSSTSDNQDQHQWSSLFYIGSGVSLLALHFVALPFLAPAFRKYCLPYVAANDIQLKMLTDSLRKQANVKQIVDLGSGDGVVCIHLAKELSIKAVGYELNPWLVLFSRARAYYEGVGDLCKFHRKDLFQADISNIDGVVLFVVPSMMASLEEKLKHEMKDDAKVYALRFPLNTWVETHYESGPPTGGYNVNQLWVYSSPQCQNSEAQSHFSS